VGRRFGQHFLADAKILDRIVDALDPRPDDVVIEVGAGTGTLTRRLAARVGRVLALERDVRLLARLRGSAGRAGSLPRNVEVVSGDALETDWHQLVGGAPHKVAGNIPYYLTSPLIDKALAPPPPLVVVYLVQREVADRLVAAPGTRAFGALTAGVQAVARVAKIRTVPAGAFSPPPRVASAVVRFVPLDQPLVPPRDQAPFRAFLGTLFSQRRKQLRRSLQNVSALSAAQAEAVLTSAGIPPDRRPEMLAPQELVRVFRRVVALTGESVSHKL
jgi:16S rRNA (adenine1518-N6/adenine1519-N6)-dimethyltransferase